MYTREIHRKEKQTGTEVQQIKVEPATARVQQRELFEVTPGAPPVPPKAAVSNSPKYREPTPLEPGSIHSGPAKLSSQAYEVQLARLAEPGKRPLVEAIPL